MLRRAASRQLLGGHAGEGRAEASPAGERRSQEKPSPSFQPLRPNPSLDAGVLWSQLTSMSAGQIFLQLPRAKRQGQLQDAGNLLPWAVSLSISLPSLLNPRMITVSGLQSLDIFIPIRSALWCSPTYATASGCHGLLVRQVPWAPPSSSSWSSSSLSSSSSSSFCRLGDRGPERL